jgi:hypothetical protein
MDEKSVVQSTFPSSALMPAVTAKHTDVVRNLRRSGLQPRSPGATASIQKSTLSSDSQTGSGWGASPHRRLFFSACWRSRARSWLPQCASVGVDRRRPRCWWYRPITPLAVSQRLRSAAQHALGVGIRRTASANHLVFRIWKGPARSQVWKNGPQSMNWSGRNFEQAATRTWAPAGVVRPVHPGGDYARLPAATWASAFVGVLLANLS